MKQNFKQNVLDYVQYKLDNPDYQIPIIYDRAFKAVIFNIKEYAIHMIAYILGIDYEEIKDAYFINTEEPTTQGIQKESIMDLLLQATNTTFINLEANNYDSTSSIVKNLSYGYRLVISKQVRGHDYKPIGFTQINFDNCHLDFNQKIINRFSLLEEDLGINHPYAIKTVRVALDNLDENPYNETISDWLYRALKLLTSNSITYSKSIAGDDPILNEVVDFMEKFSSIEEELLFVNKEEEKEIIKNTDVALAREDALKEGETKGKIAGKIEGKIEGGIEKQTEIIKNSLKLGLDVEKIAQIVNLPLEEVLKVQDEQKDLTKVQ